jgi:hypothetical protein
MLVFGSNSSSSRARFWLAVEVMVSRRLTVPSSSSRGRTIFRSTSAGLASG